MRIVCGLSIFMAIALTNPSFYKKPIFVFTLPPFANIIHTLFIASIFYPYQFYFILSCYIPPPAAKGSDILTMPEYFHSGICDACMYLMLCNEHLGDIDLYLFKIRHIYTTPTFTDESIGTLKISQNLNEEAKESFKNPWLLRDDGYIHIHSRYSACQALSLSLPC